MNFLLRGWLIFSLVENPSYVHYFKTKQERSWNNRITPSVKILLFNRFVLASQFTYDKHRRRANSEFDLRVNQTRKRLSGSLFYETGRKAMIGVSASISRLSFEDVELPGKVNPLSVILNRDEENVNLEFYYPIFSDSYFFLNVGHTRYDFVSEESNLRDSSSWQLNSGIRFPLLGRIRGILSLGYKKLLPSFAEYKSFSGLVGNTSLDCRLGRFGFRFSFSRNNQFSYWEDILYFVQYNYGGGVSFYLTQFLRLDYNYSKGENNYAGSVDLLFPDGSTEEIERHDEYTIHVAAVVFRLFENIGIGISANLWSHSSNYFGWGARGRLFIGGYLVYDF
jgi:hypothetical protein